MQIPKMKGQTMILKNNTCPSFGSTTISLTPNTPVSNKYLDKVSRYFDLKGFQGDKFFENPQLAADKIDFSQAAIVTKGNNMLIVGKDGGDGGADNFIGRILKQSFPNDKNIKFIDDIAPIELDEPLIDLTV